MVEDATQRALALAVAALGDSVGPDDVVFFYFAGHGIQVGNENYLIPVDYSGASPTAAQLTTLAASTVQTVLSRARVAMLVLDACRNNPYLGQRSGAAGFRRWRRAGA